MKRGRLEVLIIVIVLLLVLVGFSLFDVLNEKISKKEISGGVVGNINQNNQPDSTERISPSNIIDKNGYIIEFKDEPVLVKQKKLKEQAGIREIRQALPQNIKSEIDSYKQNLKQKQNNFINSIHQKENSLKSTQSSQTIQRKPLKIMNQFSDVFNGLSIDASQDVIEEIKKNPEVKRVVPNYKVNITLMDP